MYQQLDGLQGLRQTLRPELLAESRTHKASKLLRQIPCIGPIRAARLIALMQTPHRFRSKRLASAWATFANQKCLRHSQFYSNEEYQSAAAAPAGCCFIIASIPFFISFTVGSALCVPTIHV